MEPSPCGNKGPQSNAHVRRSYRGASPASTRTRFENFNPLRDGLSMRVIMNRQFMGRAEGQRTWHGGRRGLPIGIGALLLGQPHGCCSHSLTRRSLLIQNRVGFTGHLARYSPFTALGCTDRTNPTRPFYVVWSILDADPTRYGRFAQVPAFPALLSPSGFLDSRDPDSFFVQRVTTETKLVKTFLYDDDDRDGRRPLTLKSLTKCRRLRSAAALWLQLTTKPTSRGKGNTGAGRQRPHMSSPGTTSTQQVEARHRASNGSKKCQEPPTLATATATSRDTHTGEKTG